MNTLPINEVFQTIQGEAVWTGTPAVFVRLQGCPVGCPWCDTKHTWMTHPNDETRLTEILTKEKDSGRYVRLTAEELHTEIRKFKARHVVLTGGEPCMYDLTHLTTLLVQDGYTVQIETSGTFEVRVHPQAWVTVSPKLEMPGELEVRADAIARANEIKHPVGKQADLERLSALLREHNVQRSRLVWLQPLSQSPKATELCIAAATEMNWRVSIQTHKFIGVR